MARDDDRLTLNGDDDVQGVDAAVVKELSKQIRWSAMALGKIEGFFEQIVKNSEASQRRMESEARTLREETREELAQMKETVSQLKDRVARMESTVRELKITDEGLVQECNKKWEACHTLPVQPQPQLPQVSPQPPQPPSDSWSKALIRQLFKEPIYLAIAALLIAFAILAITLSSDLRSWLAQLFG